MRIETVLCPVDFTPLSERELRVAVDVCLRFGARLVVDHHVGGIPPGFLGVDWMWLEGHEDQDRAEMEQAEARLGRLVSGLPREVSGVGKLSRGPVDAALLFAAVEEEADLIVMGSHGWGAVDHHSITEEIIARAPCPVLTITDSTAESPVFRAARDTRAERLKALVPVGLHRASARTVETSVELARDLGLDLTLLHVSAADRSERLKAAATEWESRKREILEDRIRSMVEAPPPDVEYIVAHGRPRDAILQIVSERHFDLVVMGAHHGGLLRHLFSQPTSCQVLHGCPCPVWFVPRAKRHAAREEPAVV